MLKIKDSNEKLIVDFIEKNKNLIIKDVQKLIKINTVFDAKTITPDAPRGKNIAEGFVKLKKILEERNIHTWKFNEETKKYGYFSIGPKKNNNILFVSHLDTVPLGNPKDWYKNDPLSAEIKDNYIFGRGSLDDKGPLACAIWASLALIDSKIELPFELRTFVGGDEETECKSQVEYLKSEQAPRLGIVIDGEFPFAYGEKTLMDVRIFVEHPNTIIEHMTSTNVINMVPGFCESIVRLPYEKIKNDFELFCEEENIQGQIKRIDSTKTFLKFISSPTHAIFASKAKNPISYMFKFIDGSDAKSHITSFVKDLLHDDFYGNKIGINRIDPESKEGTNVNIGCVNVDKNGISIDLNIRFVNFVLSESEVIRQIDSFAKQWFSELKYSIDILKCYEGFAVNKNEGFWSDVLSAYRSITGDNSEPVLHPGGTYARYFPNSVCMGPILIHKGHKYNAHCNNEKIPIDSLIEATKIYALLVYRLFVENK